MTDRSVIFEARLFAAHAHRHQTDKCGVPFINHPEGVGAFLERDGHEPYVIAAGILHDVVEDTAWTLVDISYRFGQRIAQIVDLVTRRYDEGETYRAYIERIVASGNRDAIAVKLADIEHNSLPERNDCIQDPEERERMNKLRETRYVWAREQLEAA